VPCAHGWRQRAACGAPCGEVAKPLLNRGSSGRNHAPEGPEAQPCTALERGADLKGECSLRGQAGVAAEGPQQAVGVEHVHEVRRVQRRGLGLHGLVAQRDVRQLEGLDAGRRTRGRRAGARVRVGCAARLRRGGGTDLLGSQDGQDGRAQPLHRGGRIGAGLAGVPRGVGPRAWSVSATWGPRCRARNTEGSGVAAGAASAPAAGPGSGAMWGGPNTVGSGGRASSKES
jgi:hypothetical protein